VSCENHNNENKYTVELVQSNTWVFWYPVTSENLSNLTHQDTKEMCSTGCQNLSNPTHQDTKEMCQIVQDVRICLIWHTKIPRKCVRLSWWVGLDRFWHPVRHISLVSWCVRLDRFWHPVQSDTFPWYLGVSD
jgi:hypothetical protein